MKDLNKIQEFFSKPLEENTFKKGDKVTYLGHPAVVTAVKDKDGKTYLSVSYDKGTGKTKASDILSTDGTIKPLKEAKPVANPNKHIKGIQIQLDQLGVKYEMDPTNKVQPFKVIYKPVNKDDEWYDNFEDIVFRYNLKGVVKTSMNEALMLDKYEVDFYPNEDNVHAYIEIPSDDPTSEDTIYIKGVGETEKEAFEDLEQNYKNYKRYGLYEAKSEDKVDTITMDIPLFLRMLEYAREDAEQDLDLHDVTEKANKLGKERGILQTDDYEDIVGTTEEIKEGELTEVNLSNYGTVTPPKGGSSLVGKYSTIQGKSEYDTVIFDYQEGSNKPYGIVQVEGHGIYDNDLLKRLGLRQTRSWTAGVDVYIHDGNYTPIYVSESDFKALLDLWSGGLDREAKAQTDFYRSRGKTSGTIDEVSKEEETEFHKKLDKLVHSTFGKRKDELKENNLGHAEVKNVEKNLSPAQKEELAKLIKSGKIKTSKDLKNWQSSKKESVGEATDYMKRRKAQDDYAVNKKDKPSKSTNSKYSGKTDYMKRREKEIEENVAPNHDGKAAPFGSGYKPLEERIAEALNKINEELCPAGKAYIKRRQAAGEKSSAYLSGRAVKVCKGQMSGKSKKK